MRGPGTAALLACVAVALGGCGGGGDKTSTEDQAAQAETFRNGYAEQRLALNTTASKIGDIISAASGKTNKQVFTELQSVSRTYSADLDKLNQLDPPDERKQSFYAVTQAAHLTEVDIAQLVAGVARGNAGAAQAATKKLVTDALALKNASAVLVRALKLPKLAGE